MPHEKFHYKSLEEVEQRAAELGVNLPFAVDTHCLAYPLQVRNITFPNRLGIAPMEGADSTPEGAPSAYTVRRYVNEAIGGSAVIWFEVCAFQKFLIKERFLYVLPSFAVFEARKKL